MREDLELLRAWHAGDRSAGNELLGRHFESLYRFFASKIGDDTEAEDLIQNTLLACVKYIDKVATAESFKAYLFTIASNQLYTYVRGHIREGALIDFTIASAVELGLSPSAVVAVRERDQQLSIALRSLPLELQIILELGYWEELSATEIAAVLELPVGTAKSKIRRAKELLAKELERLGRPPLPDASDDHKNENNNDEHNNNPETEADELGLWVRQVRDLLGEPER